MQVTGQFKSKHVLFAERIEREIRAGRLRPGEPIPSVRALMASEKLSSLTVSKGLNHLSQRGLIDCFPQRGYFVSDPDRSAKKVSQIVFLTPALSDDLDLYLRGMNEAIAGRKYSVLTHSSNADLDRYHTMIREVADLRPAGVVLVALTRELCPQNLSRLAESGIPTVILGEPMPGLDCDRVIQSGSDGARRLLPHLRERGYRRPAVMVGKPEDEGTRSFLQILRHDFAERGIELPEERIFRVGDSHGYGRQPNPYIDYQEHLAGQLTRGVRFDVLICRSDYIAAGAIRALQQAHLRVPQDVAVVSSVRCGVEGVCPLRITTVDTHREEHGRVAVDVLLRRIDGYVGPSEVHHISGEWMPGETG